MSDGDEIAQWNKVKADLISPIRSRQIANGCVSFFRSTGAFATYPGQPCTPNCGCEKEAIAKTKEG